MSGGVVFLNYLKDLFAAMSVRDRIDWFYLSTATSVLAVTV